MWRLLLLASEIGSSSDPTGSMQLALITREELQVVGTWTFEGRVESPNAVIRNIRAEAFP